MYDNFKILKHALSLVCNTIPSVTNTHNWNLEDFCRYRKVILDDFFCSAFMGKGKTKSFIYGVENEVTVFDEVNSLLKVKDDHVASLGPSAPGVSTSYTYFGLSSVFFYFLETSFKEHFSKRPTRVCFCNACWRHASCLHKFRTRWGVEDLVGRWWRGLRDGAGNAEKVCLQPLSIISRWCRALRFYPEDFERCAWAHEHKSFFVSPELLRAEPNIQFFEVTSIDPHYTW